MKHTETNTPESDVVTIAVADHTARDAAIAILIVSLVVNLFVLTAWVTLKVTSAYDSEVAAFLFTR